MLVHQPQAIAFTVGKQSHRVIDNFVARTHWALIKRRLGLRVYFNAQLKLHSAASGDAAMDAKDPARTAQIEIEFETGEQCMA